MLHPAQWFNSDKWNSHNPGHLSSVFVSHHFTFLRGPLPMMPSNWLSYGPYSTVYTVNVQWNAWVFINLFVWLVILSKPKPKMYLRETIRKRRKTLWSKTAKVICYWGLGLSLKTSCSNLNLIIIVKLMIKC